MALKRKLSKSILEMKFMKRTKEKVEKEAEIAETQKMYKQNMSDKVEAGAEYFIQPSYFLCEELREGRISFRGMNTELEKYLEKTNYFNSHSTELKPVKQEAEVDDDEMAAHYSVMKKGTTTQQKYNAHKDMDNHGVEDGDNGEPPTTQKGKGNKFEPPRKKAKFLKP